MRQAAERCLSDLCRGRKRVIVTIRKIGGNFGLFSLAETENRAIL